MFKKLTCFLTIYLSFITTVIADSIVCQTGLNEMMAVFTPNQYTCNSGEFLPAYSIGCESCPDDFTCAGGTYDFNDNEFQGAIKSNRYINHNLTNMCAKNTPHELAAIFVPNVHNCNFGYYLPAGIDRCVKCLNDNYCPGGTYTFNETDDQGITACPTEHPFAPVGMWLESQCGRKLHVGNDVIYMHQQPAHPTTHRLFIQYGNTVYSANAKPKEFGIDDIKMSFGAEKSLHVILDGVEYLIYDDSLE